MYSNDSKVKLNCNLFIVQIISRNSIYGLPCNSSSISSKFSLIKSTWFFMSLLILGNVTCRNSFTWIFFSSFIEQYNLDKILTSRHFSLKKNKTKKAPKISSTRPLITFWFFCSSQLRNQLLLIIEFMILFSMVASTRLVVSQNLHVNISGSSASFMAFRIHLWHTVSPQHGSMRASFNWCTDVSCSLHKNVSRSILISIFVCFCFGIKFFLCLFIIYLL